MTIRYIKAHLMMSYGKSAHLERFVAMLEKRDRYKQYRTAKEVGLVYQRYLRAKKVWRPGLGIIRV